MEHHWTSSWPDLTQRKVPKEYKFDIHNALTKLSGGELERKEVKFPEYVTHLSLQSPIYSDSCFSQIYSTLNFITTPIPTPPYPPTTPAKNKPPGNWLLFIFPCHSGFHLPSSFKPIQIYFFPSSLSSFFGAGWGSFRLCSSITQSAPQRILLRKHETEHI